MLNEKKISKSGTITIPAHIRRNIGLEQGEKMRVEVQDNGDINLKRVIGSCIFCGTNNKIRKFKGKFVCEACEAEMKER